VATLRGELESDVILQEALAPASRGEQIVQLACKRAIDVAGAVLLGALLLIPAIIVGIIIKLESPGPILLRQWRVGKYGQLFLVYKFRTMCDRADEMVVDLQQFNEQQGPLFKMRRDPRMTPVGRWLRKLSIDEWPQLINVFRGEMSLVGPRPPLPREVQVYNDHQLRRLGAKPGMTGLWQVSGRSTLTFDQMVDMDLRYIDTWSLGLDLVILAKTLPAVITTRGAY
jgi:lipopolysaccharide/colanic/teichoic acid biosynthesis glycosyltransferase